MKNIKAKTMAVSSFARSQVQIIIPFHGQYEKTAALLYSILHTTKSNPYQIYLVDDCSPNKAFLEDIKESSICKPSPPFAPQCVCIRNEKQLGFAGSLKVAYDMCDLPWVCFLHSDCLVQDINWLIEMGRALIDLKDENVKMVSACSDNPGDNPLLKGKKGEKTGNIILKKGALPLYCAMAHRDLFKHIGGFLKPYPYAWYEDEELAFRMRKRGFKQAVCGNSWIHHEGGATVNALWNENPEIKQIMEENRDRCLADMKRLV